MNASGFAPQQFRTAPAWALVGILAGGLLAPFLVPEFGYQQSDGLFLPALVLAAGLLAGVVISGAARPASLLRVESILTAGLVYWILLDPIQGAYGLWASSRDAVQLAFVGTAVFAAGIWIGGSVASLSSGRLASKATGDLTAVTVFGLGILTFFGGILQPVLACNLNPMCFAEALYTRWDQVPWRTARFGAPGSGIDTVLKYVGYLGFLTLPLSAVLLRLEGRVNWRVIVLAVLGTLILFLLVQSGARRVVGMVVLATGLVWVLLQPRVRLRHLVRLGLLAGALLLVLEAMISWRTIGIGTGLLEGAELTSKHRGALSVDKNMHYMTGAMTVVPERQPYKPVEGLQYAVGAPIPRTVWPSKPRSRGFDLPRMMGERKAPHFSWSCSAVCDFYLMGGLAAIAGGGLLFGLLAGACNRLLFQPPSTRSRLLFAFGALALFIGLRNVRDLTAIGFFVLLGIASFFVARWLAFVLSRPSARAREVPY